MNARLFKPVGMAGRNSTMMRPGRLTKLRRPQNRPELSAIGTTGASTLAAIKAMPGAYLSHGDPNPG